MRTKDVSKKHNFKPMKKKKEKRKKKIQYLNNQEKEKGYWKEE